MLEKIDTVLNFIKNWLIKPIKWIIIFIVKIIRWILFILIVIIVKIIYFISYVTLLFKNMFYNSSRAVKTEDKSLKALLIYILYFLNVFIYKIFAFLNACIEIILKPLSYVLKYIKPDYCRN